MGELRALQRQRASEAPDWPNALRDLLAEPQQVALAFQPIVDLQRGTLAGFETLSRFPGPPIASPDKWFSAAVELGVAAELEAAVIGQALTERRYLPPNAFLSVNVSPVALVADAVIDVLTSSGSLGGVVLEITEQSPIEDYDRVLKILDGLRTLGAMVAVDDAGAGYASLAHVMTLRPELVKLDRGLVADLDRDDAKLVVVEMFGELAGRIDGWLLAEGTERPEEVEALVRLGVPLAQGYWLGRPGPVMKPVAPEIASQIVAMGDRRALAGGVGRLIEAAPSVAGDHARAEAAALFLADPGLCEVVVVDGRARPVGLLVRDATDPRPRPLMRADDSDDPASLGPRMMSRPLAERFDPVAGCDEAGRYLGLIRIERIVAHLAG